MPGIPTHKPETTTLRTLRKHWIFLLVRIQSEPLAAAFVAPLVAFGARWAGVEVKATSLSDALLQAKALAVSTDHGINHCSDQVSAAIHEGKKPDLSLPLHHLYFGPSAPFEAKRPILGTQLDAMSSWPSLLSKATQPALLSLAPAVTAAIAAATAAEAKVKEAQADIDKFQLDGERRQLFDAYNALAATTFGGLKAISHDHPELNLGTDWAESFFLHDIRNQGPTTVAQAAARVTKLEGEIAEAQQRLAELEKKQKASESVAAARSQARAAVAAAKKETAAARQREKAAIEAAKKAKRATL